MLPRRGWVVVGTPPSTRYTPSNPAAECMPRSGLHAASTTTALYRVYDLRQTAITSSTSSRPSSTTEKSSSVIAAAPRIRRPDARG